MSARLLALSRPFVALAITLTSSSLAAQSTAPAHFPARPIVKPPPYPDAPALWLRAMRLAPADPTVDGVFGQTVAVDGDTLVARQRGNAYVFVRDGNGNWNQQAKLVPPNVDTSSDETVALDGDNLVIGRPQDEGNFSYSHGTAYTYHRTGTSWALEHASTGLAVGQVGYDVAMVGDLSCITGILTKDPIFFRRRVGTSWVVEATIGCCPSGGGGIRSIAMDDSWFVVASHPWVPTSSAGKLHFYRRDGSGWTHVQTFDAPNATENDLFGNDTALSDKFVVVGAVRHDMFGTDVGAAFVYERIHAGWQSHAVLGPCNPGEREFGRSVAILGSTIVVTAQQRTDVEEVQEYRSVAHVFEQTPSGWALRQTLTIPETPYANGLGASVALDAQTIAIGSKSEDQPVPNAGAVYTFEKSAALGGNFCFGDGSGTACPCNNPGQAGSGCANAYSAVGARLDAYGTASITDDRLLLSCRGVTPGTNAFFVQGDAREANGAGVPYRDGLRCITGSLVSLGSVASCEGSMTFPAANSPTLSVLGAVPTAGTTRYYQVAYASTGPCGTGSNFTNAVAIEWAP